MEQMENRFEVKITDVSTSGEGIGRAEGVVVFVPGTVPGDIAEIEITERKKNSARGRLVKLSVPSPDRTEPFCPYFQRCGGCTLQNLTYEAQLRLKERQLRDKLERIYGGVFPEPEPIVGMDEPWHYRNKGTYAVYAGSAQMNRDGSVSNAERPRVGFYDGKDRRIVECMSCPIQSPAAEKAADALREYIKESGISVYDEKRKKGRLHQMVVRTGFKSREVMVTLVVSGRKIPRPELLTDLMFRAVDSLNDEIEARLTAKAEEEGLSSYAEVETDESWYELKSLIIDHSAGEGSHRGHQGRSGRGGASRNGRSSGSGNSFGRRKKGGFNGNGTSAGVRGAGADFEVLYGDPVITDESAGLLFELSPQSFYQVNPVQMEKLYATVLEFADLKGDETVFDLYCGVGTIGLYCARNAKYVWGIESVKSAVLDANRNAVINGIVNIQFLEGKAEEEIGPLLERLRRERAEDGFWTEHSEDSERAADVVIVDPPRAGCRPELLQAVMNAAPEKIIYVSCDPGTLARDLAYLTGTKAFEADYGAGRRDRSAGQEERRQSWASAGPEQQIAQATQGGSEARMAQATQGGNEAQIVQATQGGSEVRIAQATQGGSEAQIVQATQGGSEAQIAQAMQEDSAPQTKAVYEIKRIRPVDQFCHSGHVECVVLMSRKDI